MRRNISTADVLGARGNELDARIRIISMTRCWTERVLQNLQYFAVRAALYADLSFLQVKIP
jgi:hypothetical protein